MANLVSNMLIKPPVKILATFVVAIGLFGGAAVMRPGTISQLKTQAGKVSDGILSLPMVEGNVADILSILTDDMAVLGIFGTIVARSIVELFAQGGGAIINMMSGGSRDEF